MDEKDSQGWGTSGPRRQILTEMVSFKMDEKDPHDYKASEPRSQTLKEFVASRKAQVDEAKEIEHTELLEKFKQAIARFFPGELIQFLSPATDRLINEFLEAGIVLQSNERGYFYHFVDSRATSLKKPDSAQ